jgi:hypothetical protein
VISLGFGALWISEIVSGRDKYDREIRPIDPYAPAELETIDFRQSDIGDEAVERWEGGARQEVPRRRIGVDGMAGRFKEFPQRLEHTSVVVHDSDT